MAKGESIRRSAQLLERARKLARTGQHPDHRGVVKELEALPEFYLGGEKLQQPAIRHQLDRLCSMAQQKQATKAIAARRA